MLVILINIFVYILYGGMIWFFFENITPFLFIVELYIIPLIVNLFFCVLYSLKRKRTMAIFMSPIISITNYIVLGVIFQLNGVWQNFVDEYTVSFKNINISISSSMVTTSQIAFIILLYFGLNYLVCTIIKGGMQNEHIKSKESV